MSGWARQLVVTVSVEPDDPAVVGRVGQYRALEGLQRFHGLCRSYGVRPSYMLTWSAAEEPRCQAFARAIVAGASPSRDSRDGDAPPTAEAEFGAHLHPEEVPPIAESERGNHTLRPSQVEPGRLRQKIVNLLERVAAATGQRPTSYRSGFFDLTPAQVATLIELGIEADSSFGPLEKVGASYPFLRMPMRPYVVDPANPRREAQASHTEHQASLVEVPLTSIFRRPFPRWLFGVYFHSPGLVRGALRGLGLAELVRFRPALASGDDLLVVCRRTEQMGIPAVMTIHSNELHAGTSRTVPTEAASAAYFGRLERVFAWCRERGWASRTLTEIARDARAQAGSEEQAG